MTQKSRPSPLFDRWSVTYDSPQLQRFAYRGIHDAVLKRLDDAQPAAVVDLGCGTGQLTKRLVDRFPDASVVGVDLSAGMLSEAAGRLDASQGTGCALVRADAENLPFARRSVDLVVCTESFHWYRHQARTLDDVAGMLRPGGRLIIASIATLTTLGDRLVRNATRMGPNPIRALPPHRLRTLLRRAGFEVLHQRRIPRLGTLAWPVLTDARRSTAV